MVSFRQIPGLLVTLCLLALLRPAKAQDSGDKAYPRLHLGGQVEVQADDGSLGSAGVNSRHPVWSGLGSRPATTRLAPRRIRLIPKLQLSERLSLVNQTDFAPDELRHGKIYAALWDLYLQYHTEKDLVKLGQFKLPAGPEAEKGFRDLTVVERSDVTNQFFLRDVGIGAFGKHDHFIYGVAVIQGQGQNQADHNNSKGLNLHLGYALSPGLQVGFSGQLASYRPLHQSHDLKVRHAGVDLSYSDGPWTFEGEYIFSDGYNLFSKKDSVSQGYYLYGVYHLRKPVDLVIGYDRFDPDKGSKDPLKANNATNARDRFTVGVNYYFNRNPSRRLMFNYEFRNELEGPGLKTKGFRISYQYGW